MRDLKARKQMFLLAILPLKRKENDRDASSGHGAKGGLFQTGELKKHIL